MRYDPLGSLMERPSLQHRKPKVSTLINLVHPYHPTTTHVPVVLFVGHGMDLQDLCVPRVMEVLHMDFDKPLPDLNK
jgi:hypothetical protein